MVETGELGKRRRLRRRLVETGELGKRRRFVKTERRRLVEMVKIGKLGKRRRYFSGVSGFEDVFSASGANWLSVSKNLSAE